MQICPADAPTDLIGLWFPEKCSSCRRCSMKAEKLLAISFCVTLPLPPVCRLGSAPSMKTVVTTKECDAERNELMDTTSPPKSTTVSRIRAMSLPSIASLTQILQQRAKPVLVEFPRIVRPMLEGSYWSLARLFERTLSFSPPSFFSVESFFSLPPLVDSSLPLLLGWV